MEIKKITIHIREKGKTLLVKEYNAVSIPRINDVLDLEDLSHQLDKSIFTEAVVKKVKHAFFTHKNKNKALQYTTIIAEIQ